MFQYTTTFWVFIFQKMANFEALHWNNLSNIYLLLLKSVLLACIQGHQSVLKSSRSERGGARNFGVYKTTASKETYLSSICTLKLQLSGQIKAPRIYIFLPWTVAFCAFCLEISGRAEKVVVHMHWLIWLVWRPCIYYIKYKIFEELLFVPNSKSKIKTNKLVSPFWLMIGYTSHVFHVKNLTINEKVFYHHR